MFTKRCLIGMFLGLLMSIGVMSVSHAAGSTPMTPPNAWHGSYFNNVHLAGSPIHVWDHEAIDFNWGYRSPGGLLGSDNFSVRWTRYLSLNGRYRFTVTSDDGVRLWVNNQLIIDNWFDHAVQTFTVDVDVTGTVPVKLEYFEAGGQAEVHLSWARLQLPTHQAGSDSPFLAFVNARSLNLWQGPDEGYSVLKSVRRGTAVTLTHRNHDASWLRVILPDGTQGWLCAAYLAGNQKPFMGLPLWVDRSQARVTVANCSYLIIRKGPGVETSVVTVIPWNTPVTLIDYHSSGDKLWAKIALPDGGHGWANNNYLVAS